MWGAHTSLNRNLSKQIFELAIDEQISKTFNPTGLTPKGYDQSFLSQHVYKLIKTNSTIHDSYTCMSYQDSKPFPTERKVKDHVGSVWVPEPINITECPKECRPRDHQDWIYC